MELDTNTAKKQHPRTSAAQPKDYGRSKVTTGVELLPDLADGRSKIARRYRDIASAILSDARPPAHGLAGAEVDFTRGKPDRTTGASRHKRRPKLARIASIVKEV